MAVIEKESDKAEVARTEKHSIKPKYGAWTEENKIILQVALPGVKKEEVDIRVLNDYIRLVGKRERFNYRLGLHFGVDIEPEKTKTHYEEGLLRIELEIYKPLEHAYEVPIE